MKVIQEYLKYIHELSEEDYKEPRYSELLKKKYMSNNHYWTYVGGKNYEEVPLHVIIWNRHHPNDRVSPSDGNLIHHKNGNKLDNSPKNLVKMTKSEHDRYHMLDKRKKYKKEFAKGASIGGKNSAKRYKELQKQKKR